MIIYFTGPDSYGRQQKLNWYLEKFREKHSALTVECFDLAVPEELSRLKDFATAQSLFDNFKFGVLENLAEAEPKEIEPILQLPLESRNLTIAVSAEKALPKEFKVLKGKSVIRHEFENSKPAELIAFVRSEANRRSVKMTPTLLENLTKNFQNDKWGLITEIEKLALGGSPEPFVGDHNFFALTGEIQKSGPAAYKLAALERLLSENEPAMIFNFIASRAGADLKTKMADLDVAIKSGKLEYEEALTDLAVNG